jgi:hypothetical protein
VVDLLESGVTARLLVRCDELRGPSGLCMGRARIGKLTLLAGLLAETLAEVVRHVDC